MTVFEITVNGNKETIHAKHIVNGHYLVKKNKTNNFAQVKYIETLYGNNCHKLYRIKNFYPSSPYYSQQAEQTVTMIENNIDE